MNNEPIDDADLRKFIQKERQRLQRISEAERQALIEQRIREAFAQELAEEREESEREAEIVSAELARDPGREKERARETAKSAALLLIMLLLILLLIAAATGREDILRFPADQPTQTLRPFLNSAESTTFEQNSVLATGTAQPSPQISPLFLDYYHSHGGKDVFGLPVSRESVDDTTGRKVQWFQRARLEYWPELAPDYAVMGTLIGAKYINQEKINFPTQQPFVSQETVRYFPETGHGLTSPFLDFWNKYDGMRVLGFPISDQIQETLPDGQIYTVQYFERGRLEHHPENADINQRVQLGLLGKGLYANPDHARIIAAPTPVPLPAPAAPTPVPAPAR